MAIRISEETGRRLIKELKETKDLEKFIKDFSHFARRFGQYSPLGREYFTEAILEGLEGATITFKENK